MDWLNDLVTPVAKVAVWGLVVWLLGRTVIKKFEGAINRTLDRLTELGPGKFAPPVRPAQLTSGLEIDKPIASAAISAAVPGSLPARIEGHINTEIASFNPSEREARLVQMLAGTRIAWAFEALNTAVLGSQIQLLQALNSGPLPVSAAVANYQKAAESFPDYYRNYPFDAWLHWLVSIAHFAEQQDDTLSISEEGREFLRYLIGRGYNFARFG